MKKILGLLASFSLALTNSLSVAITQIIPINVQKDISETKSGYSPEKSPLAMKNLSKLKPLSFVFSSKNPLAKNDLIEQIVQYVEIFERRSDLNWDYSIGEIITNHEQFIKTSQVIKVESSLESKLLIGSFDVIISQLKLIEDLPTTGSKELAEKTFAELIKILEEEYFYEKIIKDIHYYYDLRSDGSWKLAIEDEYCKIIDLSFIFKVTKEKPIVVKKINIDNLTLEIEVLDDMYEVHQKN